MLRVFKLKENDPLLWTLKLKNFEVRSLLLVEAGDIFSFIYTGMPISRSLTISFHHFFCSEFLFKVENLLSKFHARVTSRLQKDTSGQLKNSRSRGQRSTPPSTPSTSGLGGLLPQAREDEEVCPICLLEMVEGESLTSCQDGCNNRLHQHCMEICKLFYGNLWIM